MNSGAEKDFGDEMSDAEKTLDLLNSIEDPAEFRRKMRDYGETVEEVDNL